MNEHNYMRRIGRQPAPGVAGEDLWQCQAADCADAGPLRELRARECKHVTRPGEQEANLLKALEADPRGTQVNVDGGTWPPAGGINDDALTMGKLVAICTSIGRVGGLTSAVMTVAPNLVRVVRDAMASTLMGDGATDTGLELHVDPRLASNTWHEGPPLVEPAQDTTVDLVKRALACADDGTYTPDTTAHFNAAIRLGVDALFAAYAACWQRGGNPPVIAVTDRDATKAELEAWDSDVELGTTRRLSISVSDGNGRPNFTQQHRLYGPQQSGFNRMACVHALLSSMVTRAEHKQAAEATTPDATVHWLNVAAARSWSAAWASL